MSTTSSSSLAANKPEQTPPSSADKRPENIDSSSAHPSTPRANKRPKKIHSSSADPSIPPAKEPTHSVGLKPTIIGHDKDGLWQSAIEAFAGTDARIWIDCSGYESGGEELCDCCGPDSDVE